MKRLRPMVRAPWCMSALALMACQQADTPDKSGKAQPADNGTAIAANMGNAAPPVAPLDGEEPVAPDNQSAKNSDSPMGPAFTGDCSLTVDGKTYLDIRNSCPIYPLNDGKGSLIVNSDGKTKVTSYFAYLQPKGDDTASVSWNEDPGADHAWAQLGDDFRRKGACWSNARAKLCATRH